MLNTMHFLENFGNLGWLPDSANYASSCKSALALIFSMLKQCANQQVSLLQRAPGSSLLRSSGPAEAPVVTVR